MPGCKVGDLSQTDSRVYGGQKVFNDEQNN